MSRSLDETLFVLYLVLGDGKRGHLGSGVVGITGSKGEEIS